MTHSKLMLSIPLNQHSLKLAKLGNTFCGSLSSSWKIIVPQIRSWPLPSTSLPNSLFSNNPITLGYIICITWTILTQSINKSWNDKCASQGTAYFLLHHNNLCLKPVLSKNARKEGSKFLTKLIKRALIFHYVFHLLLYFLCYIP